MSIVRIFTLLGLVGNKHFFIYVLKWTYFSLNNGNVWHKINKSKKTAESPVSSTDKEISNHSKYGEVLLHLQLVSIWLDCIPATKNICYFGLYLNYWILISQTED